ncbi:MAG TPA: cyclopropane-fatty-acyl-phospholipid synthase family protein [Thermohalobaculum sp.]|nr:cyclopropane-fatty-acyl-phospholipid synthase family protein [Thermohalobaculum sp.]
MRLLSWFLGRLVREGTLTVIGPDGRAETFGGEPGHQVTVRIHDPRFDWRLLKGAELMVPEAYMDGSLTFEKGNLRELIALYNTNLERRGASQVETAFERVVRVTHRFIDHNTPQRARRNAAAHYDMGNELYRLFLDEDMQYSCAYFPTGEETLEQAQLAKKRHIAAKLLLAPGQRVLDIGCGWGGMALYLAQVADVEVLGVTLSERQLEVARARARAAGLADRVTFELMDYRDVRGQFDRIVSVGMMEHVGIGQLGPYFANVLQRLTPDGVALIHSIVRKEPPGLTSTFTRKYIFPGGYIPALSETMVAVERARLWLLDCEIWRRHYGLTIGHWYDRFAANRDKAKAMHDETFCRMWEVYLAGAEGAFLTGPMAVMQLQLGRQRDAVPLTRDYLAEQTGRLRARERREAGSKSGPHGGRHGGPHGEPHGGPHGGPDAGHDKAPSIEPAK